MEEDSRMNNLARKIGIWYYSREWAEKLFEEICENVPVKAFFKMNKDRMEFMLIDGTNVKFLKNDNNSRGVALTDSYIQEGMDYTSFCTLISPVTKIGTRGLYVINSYDDIQRPKNTLEYYKR